MPSHTERMMRAYLNSVLAIGRKSNEPRLEALRPALAKVAQKVYDKWDQSDPDNDELNGGGICHLIAEDMVDVLYRKRITCTTVSSSMGEVHVWVVAKTKNGVFSVDIPPNVYETGGGYTWYKKPNVTIDADDVIIQMLDSNPKKFNMYTDGD